MRSEDLVKASNMVIGCAMEGNEQASVRGFVMVEIVLSMIIFDDRWLGCSMDPAFFLGFHNDGGNIYEDNFYDDGADDVNDHPGEWSERS